MADISDIFKRGMIIFPRIHRILEDQSKKYNFNPTYLGELTGQLTDDYWREKAPTECPTMEQLSDYVVAYLNDHYERVA